MAGPDYVYIWVNSQNDSINQGTANPINLAADTYTLTISILTLVKKR